MDTEGGEPVTDLDRAARGGWLSGLVREMGRAAQAGNAQTARLVALLAVAAAAVALVIAASR
jgi:hypothetical protein